MESLVKGWKIEAENLRSKTGHRPRAVLKKLSRSPFPSSLEGLPWQVCFQGASTLSPFEPLTLLAPPGA